MNQTFAGRTIPQIFGPCCACGENNGAYNIILLDRKAPQPGTGWGCIDCGLPQDGAIALVCDDCFAADHVIRYVIDGRLYSGRRVSLADLPADAFAHDPDRHGELA